ncbi:hypothetical protein NDN08_004485 [Rhodosorus marinus]|uniref:Uncharacterized protein n=1 Tax=Rhodosorus marinus TaxID=101924 RepID=A0AAV8UPZ5_9RHOD|nr:hypothetical protein NDN08_004485 [Rhodosorus marinus]
MSSRVRWRLNDVSVLLEASAVDAVFVARRRRGPGIIIDVQSERGWWSRHRLALPAPGCSFRDLDVDVRARSSWELVKGQCERIEVSSGRFKCGVLRGQRLELVSDPFSLNTWRILAGDEPTFAKDVRVTIDTTLAENDFTSDSYVSLLLTALITQLFRGTVSGVLGRWIPAEIGGVELTLGSVVFEMEKLVVVVNLEFSDGTRVPLNIRTGLSTADDGQTLFLDSPKVIVKNPFTGKGIPIPAGVGFEFGASLGPNVQIQRLNIGEESMNVRAVLLIPRDLFKRAAYLPGDEYRRERVEVIER